MEPCLIIKNMVEGKYYCCYKKKCDDYRIGSFFVDFHDLVYKNLRVKYKNTNGADKKIASKRSRIPP